MEVMHWWESQLALDMEGGMLGYYVQIQWGQVCGIRQLVESTMMKLGLLSCVMMEVLPLQEHIVMVLLVGTSG